MDLNNLFQAAMALDLEAIKVKLMHVESGEGWSLDKANAVEKEYRRFLCLMKLYPDEDTAPLVDVDTFWHYHILDTMKYAIDCEQVFGYFLHHYPYVGLRSGGDEQFRIDSGERMRDLYESTFGVAYPASQQDIVAQNRAQATSYRARFGIELQADPTIAWCASPGGKSAASNDAVAWCASPGSKQLASNDAVAWCASPGTKKAAGNDAVAWCASPGTKKAAGNDAIAWCASPGGKKAAVDGTVAWCASPGSKPAASNDALAWCASPGSKQTASNDAVAWCASPGSRHAAQAGTAAGRYANPGVQKPVHAA